MLGGYPRRSTESRITSSTRCWRGVRPVSSAGPSGKSVTGASVPGPLEGGPAESDGDMPLLRLVVDRLPDGSPFPTRIQTSVRTCRAFVGGMGYNFVQTFDSNTRSRKRDPFHPRASSPEVVMSPQQTLSSPETLSNPVRIRTISFDRPAVRGTSALAEPA